jgi:uncharacterized protein YyaL (SSP411 family)
MMRAFAEGARVLHRDDYRAVAERNAEFLLTNLRRDDRLLRTYKDGRARLNAYLEDYAALADGLLALYAATFEPRWFSAARTLADAILAHFWDDAGGGFYSTSDDHEDLISRPKDLFDNALPSGNSLAVDVLLRIHALSGDARYFERAERTLQGLSSVVRRAPGGFGRLLAALEYMLAAPTEVAIAGDLNSSDTSSLLAVVDDTYLPTVVTAVTRPGAVEAGLALLEGRHQVDGKAAAYVCERFACRMPVTTPGELARELDARG